MCTKAAEVKAYLDALAKIESLGPMPRSIEKVLDQILDQAFEDLYLMLEGTDIQEQMCNQDDPFEFLIKWSNQYA